MFWIGEMISARWQHKVEAIHQTVAKKNVLNTAAKIKKNSHTSGPKLQTTLFWNTDVEQNAENKRKSNWFFSI